MTTNQHEPLSTCSLETCEICSARVAGYLTALDELAESASHKQDSCACLSCDQLRERRLRVRALPPCACGCSV